MIGWFEGARCAWGAACLLAPDPVARALGSPEPDPRTRTVVRVLGARHLVQGLLSAQHPSRPVLALGVWVDAAHAVVAAGLAVAERSRARPALLDALVAAGWARSGAEHLPAAGRPHGSWEERAATRLLPVLPGGGRLGSRS